MFWTRRRIVLAAGSEDVAIVFRAGSTTELNSGLNYEQTQIIAGAPGDLKSFPSKRLHHML